MSDERQVQEVMARYVRAADHRDEAALAALFATTGKVEIFQRIEGRHELVGTLDGPEAIGQGIQLMRPHPLTGWSHHTTHDHLIAVDGDHATFDGQFIVFAILGDRVPDGGWPAEAAGVQGTVTPIESGYYRPTLRRIDGTWKLDHHRIFGDLPYALPAA